MIWNSTMTAISRAWLLNNNGSRGQLFCFSTKSKVAVLLKRAFFKYPPLPLRSQTIRDSSKRSLEEEV
jgi:hypothetical protein